MNRFSRTKHTEDSSDYISSDVDANNSNHSKLDNSHHNLSILNCNLGEDSNDSSLYEKDNENSSSAQLSQRPKRQIDDSRLIECLDYLHRMISRKDKEDIFQYPVTDLIAPGYSLIIKHPMDLSTMKKKIESHQYNSILEYREDLVLMCENCMTYNKQDTIYFSAAKKMLDYGIKLLSRDKLLSLRHTVRAMRYLTSAELGFSLEDDSSSHDVYSDISSQAIRNRIQSQQKVIHTPTYIARMSLNNNITISKSKILQKLEALNSKESYLVPPEGEDNYDEEEGSIEEQIQEIAKAAAKKLADKNKNGRVGFLRRNSNGTSGYNFLKNSSADRSSSDDLPSEIPLSIGNLSEGLQPSSYTMTNFTEEKKNKAKPFYYLENGPFSSHAPVYDSSYSNLSKEESDLLVSTYGDETAYQYALSFMEFSKGTSYKFDRYVNFVLNTLTNNEHERYVNYLANKKQQQQQNQTEKTDSVQATTVKANEVENSQ